MDDQKMLTVIGSLDLGPILFSLVEKEDGPRWSVEKAMRTEIWYRRFLFLVHKYPGEPIVPTRDIDTFWHTHILDTHKYFDDCEIIFGKYLHHFPYLGVRGADDKRDLENAFMNTLLFYKKHFNEIPTEANISQNYSMCGDCASGCRSNIKCANNIKANLTDRPSLVHQAEYNKSLNPTA